MTTMQWFALELLGGSLFILVLFAAVDQRFRTRNSSRDTIRTGRGVRQG